MTRRRQILFRLLSPIAICVVAEFLVRDVFDLRSWLGLAEQKTLAVYQGRAWAAQYFRDLADCARQSARAHQPRYARYVLQDINESCTTPTVNYRDRIRETVNPPPAPGAPVYEIAMFGGSTMEGLGAPDDQTIPSAFSHLMNGAGAGGAYRVTNYGVSGYTFTQSVMKLVTLLRDGRHFDAVIFYGGDNDIDYAYNLGEVGALESENMIRVRLEGSLLDRLDEFGKAQVNACVLCLAGVIVARNTPVLRDYLTPYLVRLRDLAHFKKGQTDDREVQDFAAGIATYYGQTHALLARVADAYHFGYLDVWQPSLMYDAGYAPGEAALARMDTRLTDPKLRELYACTRADVLQLKLDHFEDASHALDGRRTAAYLDAVHLGGDANAAVARSIYDAIEGK